MVNFIYKHKTSNCGDVKMASILVVGINEFGEEVKNYLHDNGHEAVTVDSLTEAVNWIINYNTKSDET